jgi:hypothetical protein
MHKKETKFGEILDLGGKERRPYTTIRILLYGCKMIKCMTFRWACSMHISTAELKKVNLSL